MTNDGTSALPAPIRAYLRAFVAREGRLALLRAGGWGVAAGLAWAMAACLIDRLLRLPETARAVLLLVGAAIVAGIWVRAVLRTIGAYGDWLEAAAGVERAEPRFAQRLRTVTSQILERQEYRGSPAMLQELVAQVVGEIENSRPTHASPWRRIVGPWLLAAALAGLVAGMWFVPVLGMPRLLARLSMPMSGALPATTTQIDVEPRGVKLFPGQPLLVKATVRRLSRPGADLLTSQHGALWTRIPMLPVAEGQFVLTLPALERDLYYRVEAGDADSEPYKATILRPPAVAELRLRYEFPAYTQRPPLSISNSDGVVEALVGTRVRVTVVSTEELASAELRLGGASIPMTPGASPSERQAEFVVAADGWADLDMASSGGLKAKISRVLSIQAQPDRDPLVRILEPGGDLRLLPRAQAPIQYQVMDDYGLSSLLMQVQVNSQPPTPVPVPRRGDPRRQEGVCVLDLATLNVKVGDMVSVWISATDGAGHESRSDIRRILVSPRSVDQSTRLRIADLKQAAKIASATRDELKTSSDWLERARKLVGGPDEDYVAARARLRGSLSNAVEASLLLHQTLLRACARSASRQQMTALGQCVDHARVQAWLGERLVAMESAGETEQVLAEQLAKLSDQARQLGDWARLLSEGEQAWAILAERSNLRVPASQPADAAVKQTIQRAQQETAAAVLELGLRPSARDLDAALQRRVDAELQFIQSQPVIDFESAAQQWAEAVGKGQTPLPPLVERLASAAEAQALWAEADPVAARDLQLASRAAARIAAVRASAVEKHADLAESDGILMEFPGLLGLLQREHEFTERGQASLEDAAILQVAAAARVKMAQWAMETDGSMISELSGYLPAAEDLAMAASAATARRDYDMAEAMDRRLIKTVSSEQWGASTQPAIARAMEAVRLIDEVCGEQKALGDQTQTVTDELEARKLAASQRAVAEKIGRIDGSDQSKAKLAGDSDSRRAAVAAIQGVQEQLAHLPQAMAKALDAAAGWRGAAQRAQDTQHAAQGLSGEAQAVAQRAAEQAASAMADAQEQLKSASADLDPQTAQRLAAALDAFAPETDDARQWISQRLGPALSSLQQAMQKTSGPDAAGLASKRLREAIEQAQALLSQAQSRITESDPLVAARWFAESAAQSLSADPPDIPRARGEQETASSALGRAWQNAVQDVASERLSLTPALGPLLGAAGAPTPQALGRSLSEILPGMRQWGFLRSRPPDAGSTPAHEVQPAGYQDALRVYFDYLNKTQQRRK